MTVTEERAAWLTERRNGIGGSDVAGILGLSPWQSPWSIWADKMGLTPHSEANAAQEFGLRAEPMLAQWFQDRTGLNVGSQQFVARHPEHSWRFATVDGFVFDGVAVVGVYEAKTTSEPAWETVPVHYQCQATWAMHVTGMDRCWFAVLHLAFGRPEFAVYEFALDRTDEATVVAAVDRFWHDHVLTGEPPAVDGHQATTDAMTAVYDPDPALCVEADTLARSHVRAIRAMKADIKAIEERLAAEENELRAVLGDATTLTDGIDEKGRPNVLATWKPQTTQRLDTAAIKAAHPDLAAEFTTTSDSRVLRIKPPKE